jgi:DNA-binding response OmpR family regulator
MEEKILLVDDELRVRELLYDLLIKQGYKPITVGSGEEAIELVKTQKPDLVFLDFNMPDMDGVEILKTIRSFDNKTKVVMLTGAGTEELEREARLAGAGGFLRKNLGLDVILKAVNEMFQRSQTYVENKILVVDDDPAICSLIRDFLVKKDYNVVTASSGEEALEKLTKEKPVLILLDVNLPGMDGIVTLKRIREIDSNVGTIMITGVKNQETFKEAQRLGAYEYIVKPFDLNYLETCVMVRICLVSAFMD